MVDTGLRRQLDIAGRWSARASLGAKFSLLAVGGLIYSGGILVYLRHSLPYRRAIWHAIVLLGAGAHYGAVLTGVVLA